MAKYSNTIEYNIITKLNSSGISQLQTQLKQLELSMQKFSNQKLLSDKSVSEARTQLQGLSSALTKSFNPSLGMLDLTKFNAQLKESGVSARGLSQAFSLGGAQGQVALNNLITQIGKFNSGVERTSSAADKMFNTIQNTFRWGLVSSAFSQFMNMIHQSVDYVKDLDSSLTQIMLVTDYSRAQMQEYAKSANEAAKALGNTTTGMTNASLVFAQQGYNIQDSQKLAESSVKLANASQQDTATTSDQITAYMNAYDLDMHTGELNKALDSWAEVANVSAADVAELAGASQKAASSAKAMGVSTDQLNAQIATIESVTRGAPEEIGNGLKTLYARFSDIQMGETVEGDVDLGKVTGTLDKIGVQVMDKMGNMRNVGDIMEDLMGVWQTLDDNAKKSAATTLAGKHQVDRFLALMNNSDMYEQYKISSENATGTLDKMNEEYVNSIEGKTAQLQASLEGLLMEVFNPDNFYPAIDAVKTLVETLQELVESIGGGDQLILGLASAFTKLFSMNIARTINDINSNKQLENIRQANLSQVETSLDLIGAEGPLADFVRFGKEHAGKMNQQGYSNFVEVLEMMNEAENHYAMVKEKAEKQFAATALLAGNTFNDSQMVFKDKESFGYNYQNLLDEFKARNLNFDQTALKYMNEDDFVEMGESLERYGLKLQEILELRERFYNQNQGQNYTVEQTERLWELLTHVSDAYQELKTQSGGATAEITGFSEIIEELYVELTDIGEAGNDTSNSLAKLAQIIAQVGEGIRKGEIGKETITNAPSALDRAGREITAADQAREATRRSGEAYRSTQINTEDIEGVVRLSSAVMDLTFSWQSFQSLGSLWSNDDLSLGEKVLQTVMNLSMTVTQLASAMRTFKDLGGISGIQSLLGENLSKINPAKQLFAKANMYSAVLKEQTALRTMTRDTVKDFEKYKKALLENRQALVDLRAQYGSLGVDIEAALKKGDTGAATLLMGINAIKAALSSLLPLLVIGGATAITSFFEDIKKKQEEAINTNYEEKKNQYEQSLSSIQEYNQLYDTWLKTGEGAEELRKKGEELSKTLKIMGGEALAASGQFTVLGDKINNINDDNINDLINAGTAKMEALETGAGALADMGKESVNLYSSREHIKRPLVFESGFFAGNMGEEISRTRKEAKTTRLVRENEEATDADKYKKDIEELQNREQEYNKILGQENVTEWTETAKNIAEAATQTSSFKKQIDEAKGSVSQLWDLFSNNTAISQYFSSLADDAERYAFMLEHVKDVESRVGLWEAYSKAQAENLPTFGSNSLADTQPEIQKTLNSINNPLINKEDVSKQINQVAIDTAIEQVNQSKLSAEDKDRLYSSINWSGPVDDILTTLVSAAQTGTPTFDDKQETHNRESLLTDKYQVSTDTQEEMRRIGQDSDIVKNTQTELNNNYDEAKEGLKEYTQAQIEALRAGEDLNDKTEEENNELKNQVQKMDKAKDAAEGYADSVDDLTDMVMQTQKGLEKLTKGWDKNGEILKDKSLKGTIEYAEAMGEVKDSLADVLNIESKYVSSDFVEEHLSEIDSLAQGDMSVLDDLRAAAAEDMLVNFNLNLPEEDFNYLNQKLDEWAHMEVEATTSIDDEQAIQTLNDLLSSGKITADQLNLLLNSVETDPQIEMQPGPPGNYIEIPEKHVPISVLGQEIAGIDIPNIQIPINTAVPKITNLNKGPSGVGGFPKTSSSGGGRSSGSGGRSGGGGGRGGGGSGGGGGSEKTYTPKHKDPIEEEVDLYEKVETQLDKIKGTLDGIQQETDRLIGPSGQANMRKQLTLLQKEIDLQNEKLDIQQKERDDLRNQLSPFGVTFDSEGFISNYADVLKSLEGRVNDLTNQYNADTTEEGQNRLEDEIEGAKKNLDKFKDLYKRYDELQGKEIQETINQIEELKNSIEDLSIEAYKASQKALDDIKDIRDGWAELQGFFSGFKTDSPFRGIIEDVDKLETILGRNKKSVSDYYDTLISRNEQLADSYNKAGKAAEAEAAADYANYFRREKTKALSRSAGEGGSTLLGLATADMEQLLRWQQSGTTDSPFGENQAALAEALEDAYNRVKDMLLDAEKEWEQLEEDIIDGFDKIAEKEQEHIDNFDRITNRLEHVADMIALTSGEEAYGEMAATYGQMAQTSLAEAQAQKEIVSWWEQRLSTIQDKNSDIYKAVKQHLEDAQDKLMELQKESAENFQKEYENAVQKVLANMNKKILGVSNIDRVTDDWERDKDYASRYYDDVQRANHVEQLRLKYLNLLDDAQNASLDIQRKIRDSMGEQVNYLEKQGHLSEFNVRYANAQLEILQKQLALEDARNNKNQMRLRRDTQGNYKYVYSANQDDVRQKEADLLQSEMDAYNMSTENRMDIYSQWIAAYQQYQQRYAELQQLAASQNEQVAQEARDALVKLEADFARDMKAYSEELNDSWEGMMGALSWMAETGTDTIRDSAEIAMDAIREKTDESLGAVGIQWNETINGAIEDIGGLLKVATDAWAEIGSVTVEYSNTIKTEVDSLIQDGFGNLSDCLKNAASETGELTRETAKLKDVLNADSTALQNAQKELEKYRDSLDQVRSKSSVVASTLYSTRNELETTKSQNRAQQEELDAWRSGQKTLQNQNGGDGGGGGGGDGSIDIGDSVYYDGQSWGFYDSYGSGPNWTYQNNAGWYEVFNTNNGMTALSDPGANWAWAWVENEHLSGYDTGGYTGEWGNEGRVAMLHQKELVLNAQDTENVLQAVNLVRQMTDALKGSFEIDSMVQKGTQVNKLGQDTIEQRVEITAEFPNVHNSDDIRNALLDLSNSAFQYSYKEV